MYEQDKTSIQNVKWYKLSFKNMSTWIWFQFIFGENTVCLCCSEPLQVLPDWYGQDIWT